ESPFGPETRNQYASNNPGTNQRNHHGCSSLSSATVSKFPFSICLMKISRPNTSPSPSKEKPPNKPAHDLVQCNVVATISGSAVFDASIAFASSVTAMYPCVAS